MPLRSLSRYSGVAAVVTIWTTLLAATAASGFDLLGPDPLSYLGTVPPSAVLFTIGLATTALLLAIFHGYVRRHHLVAPGFSLIMLAGLAGQMVAAFVPIGGDPTAYRVHAWCALALGASLPLLMGRFAAAQPPGRLRLLARRLFWAEVAACAIGFSLSGWRIAPLAEILPAAVFHVWVLVVTFARPRRTPIDIDEANPALHEVVASAAAAAAAGRTPAGRR